MKPMLSAQSISILQQRLGYTFHSVDLLKQALTHRSYNLQVNNERLEFMGDAVLNLVISIELYHADRQIQEGQLTFRRSRLVCSETLAQLARALQLKSCLILGQAEEKNSGRERDSILADAMEAVIGAIFLDSDFTVCQACIVSWYQDLLALDFSDGVERDPKSKLQEYTQLHHQQLPQYHLVKQWGKQHAKHFEISCKIAPLPFVAIGRGLSKQKAEQRAAASYWQHLHKKGPHDADG